jgi:hypothetical protein
MIKVYYVRFTAKVRHAVLDTQAGMLGLKHPQDAEMAKHLLFHLLHKTASERFELTEFKWKQFQKAFKPFQARHVIKPKIVKAKLKSDPDFLGKVEDIDPKLSAIIVQLSRSTQYRLIKLPKLCDITNPCPHEASIKI